MIVGSRLARVIRANALLFPHRKGSRGGVGAGGMIRVIYLVFIYEFTVDLKKNTKLKNGECGHMADLIARRQV
jgi:hypothetical protein